MDEVSPARTESRTARSALALAATALSLTRRSATAPGVRLHVQRLQRITPIQQFAPGGGNRALLDRVPGGWPIHIVAHRDLHTGRLMLVPIDERVLAGWLA